MNRWRSAFALTMAVAVSSCQTTAGYEELLGKWVGSDINQLLMSWGRPSSEFTLPDGTLAWEYLKVGNTMSMASYNEMLNTSFVNSYTPWCKTTFFIQQNSVRTWRWQGNSCRA